VFSSLGLTHPAMFIVNSQANRSLAPAALWR
jgi:hypothetical protein